MLIFHFKTVNGKKVIVILSFLAKNPTLLDAWMLRVAQHDKEHACHSELLSEESNFAGRMDASRYSA
ncbi:hypothetical protein Ctha_1935 [Chloroherpeton thalassium ATCC 35110]|uniref:Uncharacterized protein n=1 Tax=Chloroherpeton thalassium (strain ATCC 35110 / GB-78) TaxID=517418 RepID=B3QUE0_CHLT3|nr:hypothetical protein [Chloroherpeton thalassium]ACF14389.1 hypothetical protein Ctha_1935 [Chloroherpeton thalassium ATCC 35110]